MLTSFISRGGILGTFHALLGASCKKKVVICIAHLIVLGFSTELEGKIEYGNTAVK